VELWVNDGGMVGLRGLGVDGKIEKKGWEVMKMSVCARMLED
jgi:hypothetical protein